MLKEEKTTFGQFAAVSSEIDSGHEEGSLGKNFFQTLQSQCLQRACTEPLVCSKYTELTFRNVCFGADQTLWLLTVCL